MVTNVSRKLESREEDLELLIAKDDPGEDTLEEDAFRLQAGNTAARGRVSLNKANAVVIQGDGKILITGQFNGHNGSPRNGIAGILAGP